VAKELALLGNPPTFPRVPEGRVYIHSRCGSGTEISGFDFIRLCTPGGRTPTICATCRKAFPLEEFVWEDTGERVTEYLDRLKSLLPPAYKEGERKALLLGTVGLVPGALVGAGLGYLAEKSTISVVCGCGLGALGGFVIVGAIVWRTLVPHIEFRKYV
jgi:hypothetical protein